MGPALPANRNDDVCGIMMLCVLLLLPGVDRLCGDSVYDRTCHMVHINGVLAVESCTGAGAWAGDGCTCLVGIGSTPVVVEEEAPAVCLLFAHLHFFNLKACA